MIISISRMDGKMEVRVKKNRLGNTDGKDSVKVKEERKKGECIRPE